MPAPRSAQEILTTELKEIYSAEQQLSRAIPRLAKRVSSERLREMLQQRREQGATLLEELDRAFEEMEVRRGRAKNVAAEGLIEDVNQHLEEIQDERLLDPVLLASVQKIEQYCIAAWGTARSLGRLLGQERVVQAMERVLEEGKRYDEEMTRLAEEEVNPAMLEAEEGEEEQEEEGQQAEADGAQQKKSGQRGRRGGGQQAENGSQGGKQRASRGGSSGDGEDDLKAREYRDKDGNVRHHTRTYMEQHKGERKGGKA